MGFEIALKIDHAACQHDVDDDGDNVFCYDDDDDDDGGGGYVTSLCFLLKVDRWGCPSGAPPSGVL